MLTTLVCLMLSGQISNTDLFIDAVREEYRCQSYTMEFEIFHGNPKYWQHRWVEYPRQHWLSRKESKKLESLAADYGIVLK